MLAQYSVRKPYTIVVAVIMIIVLGIISYNNMTTDLLPVMELPYVVVVTTYPGASPEKVEQTVTRPLEAVLGTSSSLKNISSVSSENSSLIILEYIQDTNMDSAMIELSGSIDTVSAMFDDEVGTPILLQISPDMLPIVVASVDMKGMDIDELSEFTEDTIVPAFERLDGVASVSATGLVEKRLEIVLNEEKIADLNSQVKADIEKQLDENREELEEAQREIDKGRKALEQESPVKKEQIAKSSAELDNAIANLNGLLAEEAKLEAQKKAFEKEKAALEQLADVNQYLKEFLSGDLKDLTSEIYHAVMQEIKNRLPFDLPDLSQEEMYELYQLFEGLFPTGIEDLPSELYQSIMEQIKDRLPSGLPKFSQLEMAEFYKLLKQVSSMDIADLPSEIYQIIIKQLENRLPDELLHLPQEEMAELLGNAAKVQSRIIAIDMELQNINIRQMTLEAMKPQLESGLNQARAALEQLESGKITMAIGLAKAQMQLEQGEAELEKGLEEFEKAREQALAGADLKKILTQDLISNILMAQNFDMPAGYINEDNHQHLVKVGESFNSREEIENILVFNIDPVGDIRLNDIADIELTDNTSEMYTKVNGNAGILLTFQKQSTASTAAVSDSISDQIDALEDQYEGLSIRQLMDQGDYIYMVTDSVIENLIIGGLLAIAVLILFLWDIRPTIVIAFSIPISLMFAVTLMYFSNVTLNVISLAGLALGVGMLVDNSIVVIENIYRLRNTGLSPAKAAVEGAKQVSGAIIASTLTTVCVFLPIVFTEGLSRQLFADMGLTIGYSLVASLLVALTLVPVMGSRLLIRIKVKEHRIFNKILSVYEKILRFVLRRKSVILIPVILLLALSIYGVATMGTAFMPDVDSPQLSAVLTVPDGTGREDMYSLSDEIMNRILEIDAVETVGAMSISEGREGTIMLGGGSDNQTSFYILLKDQRSQTNRDVERLIYEKTDDLDVEMDVSATNMDISVLGGRGIRLNIRGQDLDTLMEISNDVADILSEVEGITSVETGLEDTGRETRIQVDKDKAMREGLTVAQVYAEISSALQSRKQATILTMDHDSYPVILVQEDQDGITRENIADYTFTVTQKDGTEKDVLLKDIANIQEVDSLRSIRRENQSRYLSVTAEIAEGYNVGLVSRDVEAVMADYEPPPGHEISFDGENEMINETMEDLLLMIALAIVFIYLIMVAQFQNLLSPFIVLFSLPLAFTGGLLLLWAAEMELSVVAVLGFLVLSGVVVNNGIVFVDYVNQLREEGLGKKEALVEAGVTRMRPILMTALTTILAMTTMALGYGSGAEMMQPMAVVSIGGLTYATLLTLLVVPVMYDVFVRSKSKKVRVGRKESATDQGIF
ncbi:MAG: efflux RND transporter permease subunit [Caldicoprobacterales bacterium]|jgi:multidrug efflux pump subunit AcrB|nr:MMPL family transporter [Clostridiales bacterium]